MKTTLKFIILVLILFIQPTFSQAVENGDLIVEKSAATDKLLLNDFPALKRILYSGEEIRWDRSFLESNIERDSVAIWRDVKEILPSLDRATFHIRRRTIVVIGKLASKGDPDVRVEATNYILNLLNHNHVLNSWNDVGAIIRLIESLSEIRTTETMNKLVQMDTDYWRERITIGDGQIETVDSWGNDDALPPLRKYNIKNAAIHDFVNVAFVRLYYSSHPIAQSWRNELANQFQSSNEQFRTHLERNWNFAMDTQSNLAGKGDEINRGEFEKLNKKRPKYFDF